jgi:3-isopropylmalate dehydrogenase
MHKKIAVLAGDGIGPEVMQQTLRVLDCIAEQFNHRFEYLIADIGGAAYAKCQQHCPPDTLAVCQQADAVLFGSVGGPVAEQHLPMWQHCEANSILQLRKHFGFCINLRPINIYPELRALTPLNERVILGGVDILILRELCGDLYFGKHELATVDGKQVARDEAIYDEEQIATIAHAAFQSAKQRKGRLVSVDKANVLATSKLWRQIMTEVGRQYPQVTLTHMLVDNCAMQLVIDPCQFDVIVAPNMFGDILSDLAAALPGSLGLIPSASMTVAGFGLYEPSGGSAPDIAGREIANPVAQILSATLMLRHSFALSTEAGLIEHAVRQTIACGKVTRDMQRIDAPALTTSQFTDAVIERLTV